MLSNAEKEMLKSLFDRLTRVADDIGSDALLRMFTNYPGSKTYFSHLDLGPRSPHMLAHGTKIILALAEGAQDISSLVGTLEPLQTLHAYTLRIDPSNFKLFAHCLLVSLATYLGDKFTAEMHAATDKYLSAVAAVLSLKFR